ncbi:MAG: hypothetical protein SF066_13670 [Thermoanaerobaculia bacterium]|nr:hypothetical protein [Thermoanaerobaculia bacterium]
MSPPDAKARFEAILDLYDFAVETMRTGLRHRNPNATEEEVAELFRRWLQDADNTQVPPSVVLRPSK